MIFARRIGYFLAAGEASLMRTAWMREKGPSEESIRGEILRQLFCGGADHSICPTDVGRALADHWREHMELIRDVANHMAIDGLIDIVQRGQIVDGETAQGPVRLRLVREPRE